MADSCVVYEGWDDEIKASSVTINITSCEKSKATSDQVCTNTPVKVSSHKKFKLLAQRNVTNLQSDVNDYPMLARFMGQHLCVALLKHQVNGDHSKCSETCVDAFTQNTSYITYEKDNDCTGGKCVEYSKKSLRIQILAVEERNKGIVQRASAFLLSVLVFVAARLSEV